MPDLAEKTAPGGSAADLERIAAEMMRALRGRRSRPGFSRHLGYRSNVAQRWETRLCFPRATRFFAICERCAIDVPGAIAGFLRARPSFMDGARFDEREGVAALLRELAGRTPIKTLAERSGHSRFSVARWLKGEADPTLPELLGVIEASSRRLLDFLEAFVDPARLPSVAERYRQLQVAREGAHTQPLSHAVLRALELDAYREGGHRDPGFLARAIGASPGDVERALVFLRDSGQVERGRRGLRARGVPVVDTGGDAARARALKLRWMELALERLKRGDAGSSGYALFSISRDDLQRLKEVQLAYVREMQRIIASSERNECVALFSYQLLALAAEPDPQ